MPKAENLRRQSVVRERVLNRLWEVADLSSDQTRGSMTAQVKCLAMIVAIEGLIPDRRAASAQKPVPPAVSPQIYEAAWPRKKDTGPQSSAVPEDQQEIQPTVFEDEPAPEAPEPSPEPGSNSDPGNPTVPNGVSFAEANLSPYTSFVPDTRGSVNFRKNPFARFRR